MPPLSVTGEHLEVSILEDDVNGLTYNQCDYQINLNISWHSKICQYPQWKPRESRKQQEWYCKNRDGPIQ
ncbi:unnamed protein product [Caenorhabditis brenneri]